MIRMLSGDLQVKKRGKYIISFVKNIFNKLNKSSFKMIYLAIFKEVL